MKIEIEFENSYNAKLTIDGREMRVVSKPGTVTLEGINNLDLNSTLGGLAAGQLFSTIADLQQAWAAAEDEQPGCHTWTALDNQSFSVAEQRFW